MNIKQIDLKQALELTRVGKDIMVMVPHVTNPKKWTDYAPVMLKDILKECMFFCQGTEDKTEAQEDEHKDNKKKIDIGKMKALRKAGWSYKKIADEMGISDKTVSNYLRDQQGQQAERSSQDDI